MEPNNSILFQVVLLLGVKYGLFPSQIGLIFFFFWWGGGGGGGMVKF